MIGLDPDDWFCPVCEDFNPPDAGICIMCGWDPESERQDEVVTE